MSIIIYCVIFTFSFRSEPLNISTWYLDERPQAIRNYFITMPKIYYWTVWFQSVMFTVLIFPTRRNLHEEIKKCSHVSIITLGTCY